MCKINKCKLIKVLQDVVELFPYTVLLKNSRCRLQDAVEFWSSRPEVFYKKGVLRNFAKFIEKQLC